MKKADMTWPMRIWLSIVFAFLIVDNSFAVNGSTEGPLHQTASPESNYDVIDMANQQGNGDYNARAMTGQTTRYFTTGEVDDDFWLKHLGEDYKNAIHLVVSSKNQYHDDYNMTGNEAHMLQDDSYASLKDNPVEYNDKRNTHKDIKINSADNSYLENGSGTNSTDVKDNVDTTVETSTSSYSSNETKTLEHENKTDSTMGNIEQPYERVFAMGDANMQFYNKFYNSNSFYKRNVNQKSEQAPQNIDTPNTSSQQTYTKHSQTDTNTNTDAGTDTDTNKDNTNQEGRGTSEENDSSKLANTPVVVDLPVPQKNVYELDGNDRPVVLKMPPVIYHSKPTYMQHETNLQRHYTHLQRAMPGQKPMQYNIAYSPTDQTHYQPRQYLYYQSNYFRPHIVRSYAPSPYKTLGAFNPLPSKQTSNANSNKAETGPVLRYIISKASTAKQKTAEQTPKEDMPGLTRVSRSNQELFEIGL